MGCPELWQRPGILPAEEGLTPSRARGSWGWSLGMEACKPGGGGLGPRFSKWSVAARALRPGALNRHGRLRVGGTILSLHLQDDLGFETLHEMVLAVISDL